MKEVCDQYQDEIIELAEKQENPAASHHIASCPDCQEALAEARLMMQALSAKAYDAPADLILSVKAIMPAGTQPIWAKLIRTNLSLQGVRSNEQAEILALFEAEGQKIRVQYRPLPKGWEVLGSIAAPSVGGEYAGREFKVDKNGNFQIRVADLDNSGFTLRLNDGEVAVPSIRSADQNVD